MKNSYFSLFVDKGIYYQSFSENYSYQSQFLTEQLRYPTNIQQLKH